MENVCFEGRGCLSHYLKMWLVGYAFLFLSHWFLWSIGCEGLRNKHGIRVCWRYIGWRVGDIICMLCGCESQRQNFTDRCFNLLHSRKH